MLALLMSGFTIGLERACYGVLLETATFRNTIDMDSKRGDQRSCNLARDLVVVLHKGSTLRYPMGQRYFNRSTGIILKVPCPMVNSSPSEFWISARTKLERPALCVHQAEHKNTSLFAGFK